MDHQTQYVLDTNILVRCVRDDGVWSRIRESYQLLLIEPTPIISIATTAELRSLSMQFEWGRTRIERMEFVLGYFIEVPITSRDIVTAYAAMDVHLQKQGHQLGKNDLWIAATAVIRNATLLTTDRDFDPLDPLFLKREWIPPTGEFAAD